MRTPDEIALAIDQFGKLPLHAMGRAGRRRVAGLPAAILAIGMGVWMVRRKG